MFPRMTNSSDNNKPTIRVLDNRIAERTNEEFYKPLTLKGLIKKIIGVVFISLVVIWAFYLILFVLDFGEIPAKNLSVSKMDISSDHILSFQLKSKDYSLTNNYTIDWDRKTHDIIYFTIKQPIMTKKISHNQQETELMSRTYKINVEGVSTVYYMGKDENNKFLIWER